MSTLSELIHKIKYAAVTLRFSILSMFILFFLITMLLLIGITSVRFAKALTFTSFQRMHEASSLVHEELGDLINPVIIETSFSVDLVLHNIFDNLNEVVNYTYLVNTLLPLGESVYWADKNGTFINAIEQSDGTVFTEIYDRNVTPPLHTIYKRDKRGNIIQKITNHDLHYDPRIRPWYLAAKEKKRLVWSKLYIYSSDNVYGITCAAPAYTKEGVFRGVFGIDVPLISLSRFVTGEKVSPHGLTYIVDATHGNIIAFPNIQQYLDGNTSSQQAFRKYILNLHELTAMPWLEKSLEEFNKTKQTSFSLKYHRNTYFFNYEKITIFPDKNWYIVIAVPKSDFTQYLDRLNHIIITSCLSVLLISIIVVSQLVTRIVKPILELVQETKKIKDFELEGEISIRSRITEVIYLTDALRAMKNGLRSFQKYVPKILVRQLIETEEDSRIGGTRKQLAVLFTDIKDFTTIAESIDPNELMTFMCEYFEELTKIIIDTRGTLDKYIGDSIMAFWGAPVAEVEPAEQAALAAILCQRKLVKLNATWTEQQKPQLITRIGIHLGDAIVGNLGSSERLNYTAVGDTINMASRLESINKFYGTQIIVSEEVYDIIKDRFTLRMIDQVAVKGKTQGRYIYELLAEHDSEVPFEINQYRNIFSQGFTAYCQQRFDDAIKFFQECISIYPADTVAPMFIRRCQDFKLTPPAENWNGVWVVVEK